MAAILAIGAGSALAQSQTKIYGFADAQFDAYNFNSDVTKQFLVYDTFSLALKHANVYFDFKPSEKVSALVEVGFLNRPRYKNPTGTQGMGGFTYQGKAISKDQAKDMLVQAQVAKQMATLPAGMPATMRDSIRNVIATQARPVVSAQIDQMTAAPAAGPTEVDRFGLSVERAYFDLNLSDPFKLRFGKFITPAGIWNVDHGSPAVLTVRQPIQTTTTPIFPESQSGLMGFGTVPLGNHDFSYSGYITGGRIDGASNQLTSLNGSSIDRITDLAYGGHVGVKLDMLKSISLGSSFYNGARKQKYQRTEVSVALEKLPVVDMTDIDIVDVYTRKEREIVVGGDAKIEVSNLIVQGEINYSMIDNENADGSTDLLGWYGLVAWNQTINDAVVVTPYAMYEKIGSTMDGAGTTGANGLESISTIVGGVNVSLFTNVRIKTEYTVLFFTTDSDTWQFDNVKDDDLTTGVWSTQASVAF
jgi:hypothetical protein